MAVLGVTYDVLRGASFGLPPVASNAQWVFGLTRLAAKPFFERVNLVAAQSDGGLLDTDAILRATDMPASPNTWASLTSQPQYDTVFDDFFAPHYADLDAVIGFGLTPNQMRYFDRAGVVFIDLELAQYRLSKRINFRARTNSPAVEKALNNIAYSAFQHQLEAQRAIAASLRQADLTGCRRGVFFGQTQLDLALVRDGVIATPYDADLLSSAYDLTSDLDEVHIIAHPAAQNRIGHLAPLLEKLPNSFMGSSKSYSLIQDLETVRAIAISSGTLEEAKLLGVEGHPLILPDRDNPQYLPDSLSDWIEVTDEVFSPNVLRHLARKSGSSVKVNATLTGPGLIEASFGPNQNTLAMAQDFSPIPTLRSNASYALNADGAFHNILQFGWSQPEAWGTWSVGQLASIAFRLSAGGSTELVLEGDIFTSVAKAFEFAPDLTLILNHANQITNVPLLIDGARMRAEMVIPDCDEGSLITLNFHISGACSPSAFGESTDLRKLGVGLKSLSLRQLATNDGFDIQLQDAAYYSKVHHDNIGYRVNNWLTPFAQKLSAQKFTSIVECATGNGEFAEILAPKVSKYWALDWAASPSFPYSARNLTHLRWDAYQDALPTGDLICSADFLEHLKIENLDCVLGNILDAGPNQFHVIACYDDFHSHLTIEAPNWWLNRFKTVGTDHGFEAKSWSLLPWSHRDNVRPLAIISNIDFK